MHEKPTVSSLLDPWPVDAGKRIQTMHGAVTHSRRAPDTQDFVPSGHWIGILMAPAGKVRLKFGSDRCKSMDGYVGMVAVSPAGLDASSSWASDLENILFAIAPDSIAQLSASEFGDANIEIRATHLTLDPVAHQFAKLIKTELNNTEFSNELYLDSLTTILGIHLIRNYSSLSRTTKTRRARLSPAAARRAKDYLNEHFLRKLTIAEIAGVCGLSPGHFTEAFTLTFGLPPYRYVLERRLEFSLRLIQETKLSLSEIAFMSGFSSQSHLTNVMKTQWGKTPGQFR
ncbi:helix-turn-helix domain-containing protein [Brucella intermedia]|uniref:helix-turn-helix domain-containing protein n=1 Tax=Brucella intermedia TaxID=94625 RepID=UPI0015920359|nr:AraC family transcriptional regulator [Brucella intermedia]